MQTYPSSALTPYKGRGSVKDSYVAFTTKRLYIIT